MSEAKPVSAELSRDLTLFHLVMMGLGMMIGAGVFLGIGISTGTAGPGGVVLVFALNGALAMCTAMSFAELSSAIPRAGGAYNFARIGFGRGPSFLAGWMEWFASSVAGAMYAVTFSIYTSEFLSDIGLLEFLPLSPATVDYWTPKALAVGSALFFIYINYRGASETGKVGAFFTLGQTAFMIFIGIMGLYKAATCPERFTNFSDFLPEGWLAILPAMGFTYVAFEGFEVIAQAGDEAVDPRRNIPKAMLYSVFVATLTYILVSFATMVAVGADNPAVAIDGQPVPVWKWIGSFNEMGFYESVRYLMPYANVLVTLAVVFSSTSALNATVYSATRASYALGRDRMLPAAFSKISEKRKTPYVALTFTGIIVLICATVLPTKDVASSASMMFLFLFFLVNLCVIRIRRNMGDELNYGFLMPLFPLFPVVGALCQIALSVELREMSGIAVVLGFAWIFAGIMVYIFYSSSRTISTEDEIKTFEEEKAEEPPSGFRVMLSVANPENAIRMMKTAYRLCSARKASVSLLHMVEVPEQVPLDAAEGEGYMQTGREAVVEAMLYLSHAFPVSTAIRYCRSVARGIVSAVREKKINTLILGWHGKKTGGLYGLGSTLDPVLERVPCNVLILKDVGNAEYRRVLVPLAGGRNSAYALEIAATLTDPEKGSITALNIDTGNDKDFDLTNFVASNLSKTMFPLEKINTRTVESDEVADSIMREAEEFDLVVIGCTGSKVWQQFFTPSIPEELARSCSKPVIMVKRSGRLRSWIKRWI